MRSVRTAEPDLKWQARRLHIAFCRLHRAVLNNSGGYAPEADVKNIRQGKCLMLQSDRYRLQVLHRQCQAAAENDAENQQRV